MKSPSLPSPEPSQVRASPLDRLSFTAHPQQQPNMHLSHSDSQHPAVSQSGLPRHQSTFQKLPSLATPSRILYNCDLVAVSANEGELEASIKKMLSLSKAPVSGAHPPGTSQYSSSRLCFHLKYRFGISLLHPSLTT